MCLVIATHGTWLVGTLNIPILQYKTLCINTTLALLYGLKTTFFSIIKIS